MAEAPTEKIPEEKKDLEALASRLERSVVEGVAKTISVAKNVADYLVEKSPQVARSIIIVSTSAIMSVVVFSTLIAAFPMMSYITPVTGLMLLLTIQMAVLASIVALVIGVFKRLVK